jgi:hypothetical protein
VIAERVHTLFLLEAPYLDSRVATARCQHFTAKQKRNTNLFINVVEVNQL